MVKSTGSDTDAFDKQNGLYTVCIRGVGQEKQIEENHIVSSVSRVLAASTQWDAVLETATNPHMQVIISNTTEIGFINRRQYSCNTAAIFPGKIIFFLIQEVQNI